MFLFLMFLKKFILKGRSGNTLVFIISLTLLVQLTSSYVVLSSLWFTQEINSNLSLQKTSQNVDKDFNSIPRSSFD